VGVRAGLPVPAPLRDGSERNIVQSAFANGIKTTLETKIMQTTAATTLGLFIRMKHHFILALKKFKGLAIGSLTYSTAKQQIKILEDAPSFFRVSF